MWNTRVLLALLTGASLIMIAAGFYLNRRRRRYRAVTMAKSSYLDIPNTPVSRSKLCGETKDIHYLLCCSDYQSQYSVNLPSFGAHDPETDMTPEELFRQGYIIFMCCIIMSHVTCTHM